MPYAQRATYLPEIEHVAEVRTALEAGIGRLRDAGVAASLQQMLFGPQFPAIAVLVPFEDLASMERYRSEHAEMLAGIVASAAPYLRPSIATSALLEPLVTNPNPSSSTAWLLRIIMKPLPGRGPELAALTSEWGRTRSSQGYRWSVARELVGPDAGALVMGVAFEHLEEWDELLARGRSEEAAQKYVRDAAALQAGLPVQELWQVLVPMQPA